MTAKRATGLLEGAIDLHVHVRPSARRRLMDGRELLEEASAVGMAGIVLKDHDRSTVGDAWLAAKLESDVLAAGAVCLNAPVGGLNPAAVEAALRAGARAVFLPTDSAHNDGVFWDQHGSAAKARAAGEEERRWMSRLSVLDDTGGLVDEVVDIIDLCARSGALVCTGHLAVDEVTAVVRQCARQGARASVTHAPVFTGAGPEVLGSWAADGALLELAAVFCCDVGRLSESARRSYARDAALIDAVGASAFTLSSDLGQVGNPSPVTGLSLFIEGLLAEGINESDIETMVRDNPARALGMVVAS